MLNDLILNRDEFDKKIVDILIENEIGHDLQMALSKFQLKVTSRREQVKKYEKELKNEKISDENKKHHLEFIKKVDLVEKNYESERKFIIRKSLLKGFEKVRLEIDKILLR